MSQGSSRADHRRSGGPQNSPALPGSHISRAKMPAALMGEKVRISAASSSPETGGARAPRAIDGDIVVAADAAIVAALIGLAARPRGAGRPRAGGAVRDRPRGLKPARWRSRREQDFRSAAR